ncbi:hypothetical protein PRUPE_6G244000 [Prunus persica]|uniref:Uncharacterized protein n=1 Tax=Prunus persica TaxID=3760 RepID=A0A251NV66_PRUPE|nr:hypothetical protein PRUPE_6G244000 [Prunus persica]
MAVTLSATLYSTSLPPKRNTNCPSTPVISNLNIGSLLPNLNSCKRLIKFSPRQSHVVGSAVSGSPGTESSLNGEDAASLLETVKVFDLNGNGIPISDLWKDRTAVIAFARHFGCVFCRKRADYLASKKGKAFAEQTKFKGEVYADPSHSSYEALRFVSGVLTTFTPKAARWNSSCGSW